MRRERNETETKTREGELIARVNGDVQNLEVPPKQRLRRGKRLESLNPNVGMLRYRRFLKRKVVTRSGVQYCVCH